jgi:type I restriction enzyme M protein
MRSPDTFERISVADQGRVDLPALEQWLWDAACSIRGAMDAPKFKDFILPLVFLKRLSDVYEGEIARLAGEFGSEARAEQLVAADHDLVRFFVPEPARWSAIARTTTALGEQLTDAVRATARENQRLAGVIDMVDFNATTAGQRMVDDGRLTTLVQVLGRHRLGLGDVEPDILGRAYEYLLRKFAESQGQSAGEFYTPREVAVLMARILDPQPGESVYDPCCGSGGLLIKCHLRLVETHGGGGHGLPSGVAPLQLFGQELNTSTFAISKMNSVIHDMEAEIALGDTMAAPRFTESDSKLRRFDIVTANPMWNQDFPPSTYEHDPYERFEFGDARREVHGLAEVVPLLEQDRPRMQTDVRRG